MVACREVGSAIEGEPPMPRTTLRTDFVGHRPTPVAHGNEPPSVVEPVTAGEAAHIEPLASASAGLAGSPAAIAAVCFAWAVIGWLIARLLVERGHDRRTMTAMGIALGPLLGAVAVGSVRWRTATAPPIVLDPGGHRSGPAMMVAVSGRSEDVAGIEAFLGLVGEGVGHIDLVARIDIEDAVDGELAIAESPNACRAAATLRGAATFLADREPGLILVAGPPRSALADYALGRGYDFVGVTGPLRDRESLARALERRRCPAVVVAPGRAIRADVRCWT
jgi:hypothetical protein